MAATKVGVVYSEAQKIIRRIIKVDEDAHLEPHKEILLPGEVWAEIPLDHYNTLKSHHECHLALGLTGIHGVDDRCVLVSPDGLVEHIFLADPVIDSPGGVHRNTEHLANFPKHKMVVHKRAMRGDKIIDGVHIPAAVAP